jgi:Tfp pilus assembly PilM family ATPase/Tfp pilus assembly protein PilN
MRFSNRYITALDIQDRYVRCVQIGYFSRSWNVQKTSLKEIPASEDNEESSHDIHTAHVIKSLLQEIDTYPPRNLVTCISGKDAAVRLLGLPPVGDRNVKDIEEMVKYELMMHLPVNIEQMGYDYQIIERNDDVTRILTVAAKRSVLNRHLRLLSLAGVYPDVVTTSSLMLFNTFAGKSPESIKSGRVGLVCLRDPNGDVVVCEDGNLTYARSFTFQIDGDREQLARELHNSFDTYSKARTSDGESGAKSPVNVIYLTTEDGQLPAGLTEDDMSRIVPGSRWKIRPAGDDLAFGLALADARFDFKSPHPPFQRGSKRVAPFQRGSKRVALFQRGSKRVALLRINLLKQIARERRAAERKATRVKLGRMAPAIAIFALLAISGAIWWQVYRAEGNLYLTENARQASKEQRSLISQKEEEHKGLQEQIEFLDWVEDDYPMVSYRLYEIARAIPDSLWLKEVYIPEKQASRKRERSEQQSLSKLYVVGYAHEQYQIEDFLSGLRKIDCFSDVKQENTSEVRLAGERVLEFRIGLTSRNSKT